MDIVTKQSNKLAVENKLTREETRRQTIQWLVAISTKRCKTAVDITIKSSVNIRNADNIKAD